MSGVRTLPLLALRPLDLRKSSVAPKAFRFARRPVPTGLRPCPDVGHYEIKNPNEAYWRVLYRHPTDGERSNSIVGPTGHLERANAWTHLVAAAGFAVYALCRPWAIEMHSLTSQLSGVSVITSALAFSVSVTYHVYGTVRGCAPMMRNLDYLAIYAAMAMAATADLSLVTVDFDGVPFQTVVDPLLASIAVGVYFTTRRFLIPADETRDVMFEESCSLGLFRFFHSDLEHAPLRVVCVGTITMVWILMVAPAFSNLTVAAAGVWMAGVLTASLLLVSGVIFDNLYAPDKAFAAGDTDCMACTSCYSKELGCVFSSHSWWHVISVVGAVLAVVAREFGVSQIP